MTYLDVKEADSLEEYGTKLLAYGGERLQKVGTTFGFESAEFEVALGRWSEIYRLQTKMWPTDVDISIVDNIPANLR